MSILICNREKRQLSSIILYLGSQHRLAWMVTKLKIGPPPSSVPPSIAVNSSPSLTNVYVNTHLLKQWIEPLQNRVFSQRNFIDQQRSAFLHCRNNHPISPAESIADLLSRAMNQSVLQTHTSNTYPPFSLGRSLPKRSAVSVLS